MLALVEGQGHLQRSHWRGALEMMPVRLAHGPYVAYQDKRGSSDRGWGSVN